MGQQESSIVKRHDPTSQAGRILRHLKKHKKITNIQMINDHILRGSERIRELKAEGYIIRSERLEDGKWVYIYQGHEDEVAA